MRTQRNKDIEFPTRTPRQKKLWIIPWLVIVGVLAFCLFGEWTCPTCEGMKKVQEVKECPTCRGTGKETLKCENCKGMGKTGWFSSECEKCNGKKTVEVPCNKCEGKGRLRRIITCKFCEGTGELTVRKWLMN